MAKPEFELDPDIEEPPMLAFVREYWWHQRGDRAMPSRRDISPAQMKSHLPHILLADVIEGGLDFRYRLVGGELQRFFSGNPTGKSMSDALAAFGAQTVETTLEMYRMAIRRGTPLRVRGTGSYFSQGAKLVDALLTPLSDDGQNANMIFGTFTFIWDKRMRMALSRGPSEVDLANVLQENR
jgi:hypothetical protein